ncbi:TPA: hypothetical protein ACXDAY_002296 [Clostridium botulinum]|uniref:hypothetical protein n=1 Tax=Clostridium botulinum TaxID=1491 RepID=UPI000467AC6C|nr:hypothetical protein [Clostridium botulinum]APR02537.1 hypothetical protein RSJ2_4175 [Clostridium botulinum]MBN3359394.1 hypothetical protein [Clostridium botulinum]MBN3367222.1 hypothetical protein [Clostridium botulinum]MBN3371606.1 hypothetical protein [Clostridium botulinum]MBN3376551.1 hypothetical protein [Clostridium botulinum]
MLEVVKYALKYQEDILNFDYDKINDGIFAVVHKYIKEDCKKVKNRITKENFLELQKLNDKLPKEKVYNAIKKDMPIEQIVWTQCRNILFDPSLYNNDLKISDILHTIDDFALNEFAIKQEKEAKWLIDLKFNLSKPEEINKKLEDIYNNIDIESDYCKIDENRKSRTHGILNYLKSL